jgi:hypothetical protein
MPKISEFTTVVSPEMTALMPVVEVGTPNLNKKITLTNLKTKLFTPATSTVLGTVKIGSTLTVDGSGVVDVAVPVPSQATHTGKYLTTNGSVLSWATVPTGTTLPSQTGNENKFLKTNGSTITWENAPSLTVITPDDIEINGVSTLVLTGAGVTTSSVGNAVTLDISGGGSGNIGNFTFNENDASLAPGSTMTLSTYQNGGNKESRLTLSPTTASTLYVGNNLELGVAYGTGFEYYWKFKSNAALEFPDSSNQYTAYIPDTVWDVSPFINLSNIVDLTDTEIVSKFIYLNPLSDATLIMPNFASWPADTFLIRNDNSSSTVTVNDINGNITRLTPNSSVQISSDGFSWFINEDNSTLGKLVYSTIDKSNNTSLLITADVTPGSNVNWNEGTYNFTFAGNGAGYVVVDPDGVAGVTIETAGTAQWTTGATLAVISGNTLGGTTGPDDLTINVATRGPTNIDLTKSVNKLIEGTYFLGDGVEGQMMYLVSHPTVTTPANVVVDVYASRDNSAAFTYRQLIPFSNGGVCTLLFTAASWQLVNGGAFV